MNCDVARSPAAFMGDIEMAKRILVADDNADIRKVIRSFGTASCLFELAVKTL